MSEIESSSIISRIKKAGISTAIGKLLTISLAIIIQFMLANILSHSSYGVFFIFFSMAGLIAIIVQMGVNQTLVKELSRDLISSRNQGRSILFKSYMLANISAIVFLALWIGGLGQIITNIVIDELSTNKLVLVVGIWILVFSYQGIHSEIFRGMHLPTLAIVFGGLLNNILLAIVFFTIHINNIENSLLSVLVCYIICGVIQNNLARIIVFWMSKKKYPRGNPISYRKLMITSGPLMLSSVFFVIVEQMDVFALSILGSDSDLALYGLSTRFARMIMIPFIIVNALVPPYIVELYSQNKTRKLEQILNKINWIALSIGILLSLCFVLFGKGLIVHGFSPDYGSVWLISLILIGSQLFNIATGPGIIFLAVTGEQKLLVCIGIFIIASKLIVISIFYYNIDVFYITYITAFGLVLQSICTMYFCSKRKGIRIAINIPMSYLKTN